MAKRPEKEFSKKPAEGSKEESKKDLSARKSSMSEPKKFNFSPKSEVQDSEDKPLYHSKRDGDKRKTRTNLKKEAKNRIERGDNKPYHKDSDNKGSKRESSFDNKRDSDESTYKEKGHDAPRNRRTNLKKEGLKGKGDYKSQDRDSTGRRPRREGDFEKPRQSKPGSESRGYKRDDKFAEKSNFKSRKPRSFESDDDNSNRRSEWMDEVPASWKTKKEYKPKKRKEPTLEEKDGKIRLNKYISNAGICSRREADDLIKSGAVKVNGKVVTEMGFRISLEDKVQYGEQTLSKELKRYLLLNKPKDYITTANDPDGRKTVMELIVKACKERLYPVGRLDRATTGLLLFTNDGELARKLTHPSHEIKKVYHVTLSKNLKAVDLKRIMEGLELEDGIAEVDSIDWVGDGKTKNEVGIELHSGKNRIVRRIFEHLGYEVVKLDRTFFAGLTKKDLPRGNYRFLSEKELVMLKMS